VNLAATRDPALDPALVTALEPWLRAQRWFPVKGTQVTCTALGGIDLTPPGHPGQPDDPPRVRVLLVAVVGATAQAVLQVPLVLAPPVPGRPAAPDELAVLDAPAVPGGLVVHDGVGHPAFVAAWLALADGPVADPALHAQIDPAASRVLTVEQSNTSVVLGGPDGPVGVLKVLRSLTAGDNPDVDVPRHLAEVGWDAVPTPLGWLRATWPGSGRQSGYLAAMTRFVPDATDGFTLACDHAGRSASFAALAGDLGTVVASMHRALLAAYGPVDDAGAEGGPRLATVLNERFAWACQQLPDLAAHTDAVAARARALVSSTGLPRRQRVHGDLHLGQVLRSADRWFVTDFEGEPLAPVQVRTRPDLALRDVAGVLRSFDYAAAVGGLTGPATDTWVAACRESFWSAYCAASDDPSLPRLTDVLTALELDKVLYEVVYESRNRPDWLPIPRHGLDRLLSATPA